MENNSELKTKIIKVLAIVFLVIGLGLLIYGMVEYMMFVPNNTTTLGIFDRPLIIIYSSSPLLFGGFYLFVLGWGRKPNKF